MKVLVVGASGFLGGEIARVFMADGHEVSGTYVNGKDRLPVGCTALSFEESLTLHDGDFEVVVLAAGNHALPPKELVEANYNVAHDSMRAFPSAKMVYVSSIAVYGDHEDVMNEQSVFDNPSYYGWAKLAGEAIVRTHPTYAIIRPTYLFGPTMPQRSFVPAIINKAKTEGQITLFGKGERLQDYLHVTDAAQLCLLAAKHEENDTFLAATGNSISNKQVAEAICAAIPECKLEFSGEDTAPWFQFDPSITKQKLSWKPQYSLLDSIKDLI